MHWIFTKKINRLFLAIPLTIFVIWRLCAPYSWASERAEAAIAECYAAGSNGSGPNFGLIRANLHDAENLYGGLISYKFVSLHRGLFNSSYDVTVNAKRQRAETQEVFKVNAGIDRVNKQPWVSLHDLAVTPR